MCALRRVGGWLVQVRCAVKPSRASRRAVKRETQRLRELWFSEERAHEDTRRELKRARRLDPHCFGVCSNCGSADLAWSCMQTNRSGIADGRLRMHDVSTSFVYSCNECSETLRTASGDQVARWITGGLWGAP